MHVDLRGLASAQSSSAAPHLRYQHRVEAQEPRLTPQAQGPGLPRSHPALCCRWKPQPGSRLRYVLAPAGSGEAPLPTAAASAGGEAPGEASGEAPGEAPGEVSGEAPGAASGAAGAAGASCARAALASWSAARRCAMLGIRAT